MVPIRREEGVLKRWRGTPLPPWIYLLGTIFMSFVIAAAGVVLMVALGIAAYGVRIEPAKLPAMVVTFLVGVGELRRPRAGGRRVCKTAQSAAAVANVIILPMAFISDVFIALEDPPRLLEVARRRAAAQAVRAEPSRTR